MDLRMCVCVLAHCVSTWQHLFAFDVGKFWWTQSEIRLLNYIDTQCRIFPSIIKESINLTSNCDEITWTKRIEWKRLFKTFRTLNDNVWTLRYFSICRCQFGLVSFKITPLIVTPPIKPLNHRNRKIKEREREMD